MLQVSVQRNDPDAVAVWKYVWSLIDKLGHNGMSDEEDDEMVLQQPDGTMRLTHVRKILKLIWRHPYFSELFKFLDKLPGVEDLVFRLCGKQRIERVRVEQESDREPPPNLPKSFYRPNYLEQIPSYRIRDYKLSTERIRLREIHFDE